MDEIVGEQKTKRGLLKLGMVALTIACLIVAESGLFAQANPAAKRLLDVQVGGMFHVAKPDYGAKRLRGFGAYGTFDWRQHLGIEASLRTLVDGDESRNLRIRSFEVGPRYVLHAGPWSPYVKVLYGRGDFQFPPLTGSRRAAAQLAYNFWATGAGVDYAFRPSINLRVDYEYQQWRGFPPNGLTPQILSFGIAYHFH